MIHDGKQLGRKKIIISILVVLFINLLPLTIATENQTVGSIVSVGYGKTKIF